jgi:hypothetical protein
MCCESDDKATVHDKLKKLVMFTTDLVHDLQVVGVELLDQELENVCQGKIDREYLSCRKLIMSR